VKRRIERLARQVVANFRGPKPADMPRKLTKFELIIDVKTAKVIGIKVPPSLLAHADR